jgi:hypothetical protein
MIGVTIGHEPGSKEALEDSAPQGFHLEIENYVRRKRREHAIEHQRLLSSLSKWRLGVRRHFLAALTLQSRNLPASPRGLIVLLTNRCQNRKRKLFA